MKFTILTLFPNMIRPFLEHSVLGRAQQAGAIKVNLKDLRDWASDRHRTVDDTPYGGGPGMVLKVDVIDRALAELAPAQRTPTIRRILLTPQGERFTQSTAERLARSEEDILLIAGHYEGFDERVRQLVDEEISVGDFVLTGGELAAASIVDAVARLRPGVLGNPASLESETHSSQVTDYPTYTRPERYAPLSRTGINELVVPEILLSGNHEEIAAWRAVARKQKQ